MPSRAAVTAIFSRCRQKEQRHAAFTRTTRSAPPFIQFNWVLLVNSPYVTCHLSEVTCSCASHLRGRLCKELAPLASSSFADCVNRDNIASGAVSPCTLFHQAIMKHTQGSHHLHCILGVFPKLLSRLLHRGTKMPKAFSAHLLLGTRKPHKNVTSLIISNM